MARESQIQVRRDTAANWVSVNPTLAAGEIGFETDTKGMKIGDGSTTWNNLFYETAPIMSTYGSSGNWWFAQIGASNSQTATLNQLSMAPIYFPARVSIQAVQINIASASAATGVIRLGLYQHDATTGRPKLNTNPLADWGTVAATATGVVSITGLSSTLPAGWAWIAFCGQVAGTPTVTSFNNYAWGAMVQNTNSTTAPTSSQTTTSGGYSVTGVTGAFGQLTTLTTNNFTPIKIAFKTT